MANAPNSGSTLTLPSGLNKTSTAVSTNIVVLVNNTPVGAIKTLSITETRSIAMVHELGTDGVIDSTPNRSTEFTLDCTRTRFDKLRIAEAFGRGFIHAQSQAYPFDIVILDKQKRDKGSQITTVLKNCWIKSISYSYGSEDWVISDTMNLSVERIFSVLNGGSSSTSSGGNPVAIGGELGIKHIGAGPNGVGNMQSGDGIVNIEQLADTGAGGRGGSLDAAGIIDISSGGVALF